MARSHGSHCDQSSKSVPSVCPISSERNPEQSTKKSASSLRPSSIVTEAMSPLSCMPTSTILPFGAADSMLLGKGPEITRIERSIEVEGVGDVPDRGIPHVLARVHELVLQCRGGVDRVIGEIPRAAPLIGAEPVMVAAQPFPVLADNAEAVDVFVALFPPVDELDAELEGAPGSSP